jgi:hypothetical protein
MREIIAEAPGIDAGLNLDPETASGVDRLIAISHHAQQKFCATILHLSLVERLLDAPEPDRAAIRRVLSRLATVNHAAADAVSELQMLVQAHPAGRAPAPGCPLGACDAR